MSKKIKKISVRLILMIILGSFIFSTFSISTAYAGDADLIAEMGGGGGGFAVYETGSIPQTIRNIIEKIQSSLQAALVNAGVRAAAYATQKVAYDSAVWLASGSKGQSPMFFTNSPGKYLENVTNETAGVMIESLGSAAGLNLCKIPNLQVDLAMRIGLRTNYLGPPKKPECTGVQFYKTWKDGFSKFGKKGGITAGFSASLKVDDSDLGIYTQATEKINNQILAQKYDKVLDRQEGQGFKSIVDKISGTKRAPAQTTKEFADQQTPDKTNKRNKDQLDAALASDNVKLWPTALQIFLSTLTSNLLKNFLEKGLSPAAEKLYSPGSALDFSYSGASLFGRAAAQVFFSYLQTVKLKEAPDYDLVAELNSCPEVASIFNCRMGSDLVSAVNQEITIGEALKKGVLDGTKKLFHPSLADKNNDPNCFKNGYCLNNIKILRQVRILPLGFEIAIGRSDPDKPWTLKQVVDGFNDCPATPSDEFDPAHPFCHLIDPNWVLKAPDSRCVALVSGPNILDSDVSERLQECANLQTCVGYDAGGNCNHYGYCAREKNTWKFAADSCEPEYATCRSFEDSNGNSVSYLYRTLDTSWCNSENVGCKAYSLTKRNGDWVSPMFDSRIGKNTGIYLNQNVDKSCSANSVGCSAFQIASGNNDLLFLKKAPDYLNCYDIDTSTPAIDWPQTVAELNNFQTSPECKKYSEVCIPEEKSCNWYSRVVGDTSSIPARFTPAVVSNGVVTWNDECDARCNGYDVYREMPSTFSNGQDLAYIIPSSGSSCNALDVGCTSFTNLATTNGGVENREYYTYLRPCEKPSATVTGTIFITYEGSRDTGFQLKTYTLLADASGGPQYFYKDLTDLASMQTDCTEARYQSGAASLDCRQFIDQNGRTYYRLLAKTIPVDLSCTPYRINEPEFYTDASKDSTTCSDAGGFWDAGECKMCLQGGKYQGNTCIYNGLPGGAVNNAGVSQACSASVDTCRAYKGNAGNNIQVIFNDNFENGISGWNQAAVSNVSTRVGGHSLELTGPGNASKSLSLETGKSYQVTFWGKGSGINVNVSLGTTSIGVVSLGDVWQEYKLGPVEFAGNSPVNLTFLVAGTSRVYFDNIKLSKITDLIYRVKKTLKVDPVCDSTPADNLPGEALGCSAYTDPQKRTFYLTRFTNICRENAIGCTELFDTFNTLSDTRSQAYNVRLSGAPGSTATGTIGSDTYSCQVPLDRNWCFVDILGYSASEISAALGFSMTTSTVIVPADTPSSTPIYLVANQSASCSQSDLGCTYAGALQKTATGTLYYVTTTIKNDPSTYSDTICEAEAVGCNAFTDGTDTRYFKDPKEVNQTICEYKENVPSEGRMINGWFKKAITPAELCYPTYQLSHNVYGIWSSGNTSTYKNFVGECPADQNKCTEFIDHADSDRSYFLIKDENVNEGDCSGQVSQKSGCALFEEKEKPAKLWNTAASYIASDALSGQLVAPVTNASNDANTIIKVVQDRECGEWLECGNSYSAFDEATNKFKTVCQNLNRCRLEGNGGYICGGTVTSSYSNNRLTENIYRGRNVTWSAMDYSGFSLLNYYPIEELKQHNYASSTTAEDYRLVMKIPCGGVNCTASFGAESTICETNNQSCGTGGIGACINKTCVLSVDGRSVSYSPKHECRAYPEKDSPFPGTYNLLKSAGYEQVKVCDERDPYNCECDYRKVQYGDMITKYWNINRSESVDKVLGSVASTPAGICFGGTNNAQMCTRDSQCPGGGTCETKRGERAFIGWKGICLERDNTRRLNAEESDTPCLTWYPIDSLVGAADINNQHIEAGSDWHSTPSGQTYCLTSSGSSTSTMTFQLRISDKGLTHGGYRWGCGGYDYGFGDPSCSGRRVGSGNLDYWSDFNRGTIYIDTGRTGGVANVWDIDGNSGNGIQTFPNLGFQNIRKQDIARIEVTVLHSSFTSGAYYTGCCGNSAVIGEDLGVNQKFYIFPNSSQVGGAQTFYNPTNNGTAVAGFYRGNLNEPSIFYSSHLGLNGENGISNNGTINFMGRSQGITGNFFALPSSTDSLGYSAFPRGSGVDIWDHQISNIMTLCPYSLAATNNAETLDNGVYQTGSAGSSIPGLWHGIRFVFSTSTGKFEKIDAAYCGGNSYTLTDSGAAGHSAAQPYNLTYEVKFVLHEWCTNIADAPIEFTNNTNRTRPWTNRLFSIDGQYPVPQLGYLYSRSNPGFGSAGSVLSLSGRSQPVVINGPNAIYQFDNNSCPYSLFSECGPVDEDVSDELLQYQTPPLGGAAYSSVGVTGNNPRGQSIGAFGTIPGVLPDGVERLGTLFGSILNHYEYSRGSSSGYEVTTTPANNFTEFGDPITNVRPQPPQIHPLGKRVANQGSSVAAQYEEQMTPGVTVNGKSGGYVTADSNSFVSYLDFYAFANENQMPLRNITVDWGDGADNKTIMPGYFRNQRGLLQTRCESGFCVVSSTSARVKNSSNQDVACLVDANSQLYCDPIQQCVDRTRAPNYGFIVNQTCDNRYFHFEKTYNCSDRMRRCDDQNDTGCFTTSSSWCGTNGVANYSDGCCIFQPKVQVTDNWGWCNGTCPDADPNTGVTSDSSPGGTRCYDKSWNSIDRNECRTYSSAYTPFEGKIILPPD